MGLAFSSCVGCGMAILLVEDTRDAPEPGCRPQLWLWLVGLVSLHCVQGSCQLNLGFAGHEIDSWANIVTRSNRNSNPHFSVFLNQLKGLTLPPLARAKNSAWFMFCDSPWGCAGACGVHTVQMWEGHLSSCSGCPMGLLGAGFSWDLF